MLLGHINIIVELHRDRWHEGSLKLLEYEGFGEGQAKELLSGIRCRGKADTARAERADNPTRDPTKPYGDFPTGDYKPTQLNIFTHPHARIGIGWIPLEGISGQALDALNGHRTGLGIHAGRGDERLVATYGCLRVRDTDFKKMHEIIGRKPVYVMCREID